MLQSIQIFIADDQPKVRFALRVALEQHGSARIIGEAENTIDMLSALKHLAPDAILLDWELPGLVGSTLSALRVILPKTAIIAMSSRSENSKTALRFGACAFINKSEPPESLLQTLKQTTHLAFGLPTQHANIF